MTMMTMPTSRLSGRGRHSNLNPLQAEFRIYLNDLRTARGLSQNGLARALGVNPSYVNRLLMGLPIEQPIQATRQMTLMLADVFELDEDQTDRLLHLAGHATRRDFQAICESFRAQLVLS